MKNVSTPVCGLILHTTALVALANLATPTTAVVQGCDEFTMPAPQGCGQFNASTVIGVPVGENTERVRLVPGGEFASTGFSISLDNQTIASAPVPRNTQQVADIALGFQFCVKAFFCQALWLLSGFIS